MAKPPPITPSSSPTFSSDGTRLFAASQDGALLVFDATNGERLLALPGPSPQPAICVSARDGLVVVGTSRALRFWDGAPLNR